MATGHLLDMIWLKKLMMSPALYFVLFFALPSHHARHACSFHISTFLLTVRRVFCVFALIGPSRVSVAAPHWTEAVCLPHHGHHRWSPLLLLQLLPCHFEWRCRQKRLYCGCKSTHTRCTKSGETTS